MQFSQIVVWNVAILALIPGLTLAGPAAAPLVPRGSTTTPSPSGAATPAASKETEGPSRGLLRMTVTATTERIPLPQTRGPIAIFTDALGHRVRLVPAKGDSAALLHARILKHTGFLCPKVELKEGGVELTCRTARLEMQVSREGKEWYLDINELRGLPWRPGTDAPPSYHYEPFRLGLGRTCPGNSPAGRGECELKDGHILEAAVQFRAALDTTARQMACVRLGDIAISTGDPITAAGWYRRAGSFGIFGRIADSRLCELDGRCLQTTEQVMHAFDVTGMPEPLRAEATMRGARAEAYMGRLPSAAQIIARQVHAHGANSVCREGGELLCRRILVEAMHAADVELGGPRFGGARVANMSGRTAGRSAPLLEKPEHDYLEELLDTYLALPSWDKGPLAVEMVQAAAPLAARLGAPAFGGNLLAALAPQVPDAKLADHLLLAAETFLQGENWARARIVVEYAQSRLTGKSGRNDPRLQGPRWAAVLQMLAAHAAQDEVSPAERAAIEAEFKATLRELKRARQVLAKVEGVVGGNREAHSQAGARGPNGGAPTLPAVGTKLAKNSDRNSDKDSDKNSDKTSESQQ